MPLDDLTGVIETLQQRIRQHGPITLRANETRTRMALIDPLLCALGWNTADPALVTPEYRVDVGWADYALHGLGTQPIAIIEAKRLGSIVDNHLEQAVGYCIQQGIAYAGVTDGSHWQLYRTFEPVPLVDKLVLDIHIADAPAHQSALQLLLLWRPNLASGQPMPASAPILAALTESETAHIATPIVAEPPVPTSVPTPLLATPVSAGLVRLADVKPEKGKNPQGYIRLPNGEERSISDWVDVIAVIGAWLYSEQRLHPDNCTLANSNSSRAQYITHTRPIHKTGREFKRPTELGRNVFIEKSWGHSGMIKVAVKLLQHCGVNPADVFVQTAPWPQPYKSR